MTSGSSRQALYAHLHRLLDEYVAEHLTTDYVDCTQLRVYQVLTSGLLPVSVDDPHSLVLPSDPLEDFVHKHCQVEPKDMYEGLKADNKSQELIRHTLKAATLAERSFTSKFPDHFCHYPRTDLLTDPPVLAVHSIRHTPIPGCSKTPRFAPLSMREVLDQDVRKLASDKEDIDTHAKEDFHCRLTVDDHTWNEILLSYQASPFSITRTKEAESAFCNKFLCKTLSPHIPTSSPETPPLFSRVNLPQKQPTYVVPASVSDPPLVQPLMSGSGSEMTPEYAAVNDDWAASSISSPPTLYVNDDSCEQSEIFAPSSEAQKPINDLLGATIDAFHMPRQSCVRGFCEPLKVPGQGQLLHGYVGHVLCMTRGPEVATAPSSASDTIFSPFHPVHHVGALTALNNTCRSPDNSEDAVFGRLILGFPDETIDAILFDQPLDTESGFMDVPQLLAPNSHTRNTVWPIDMSSLITFNGFSAFYTVKGVKSLNLELTWRPFNSEQAMPTLEELAGISELNYFGENDIDVEDARAQVVGLLEWLDPFKHSVSLEEENQGRLQALLRSPENLDLVTNDFSPLDNGISNVLLTRAERHRFRLLRKISMGRDYDHAEQWIEGDHNTEPQSLDRSTDGNSSKDDHHGRCTDYVQVDSIDSSLLIRAQALPSNPLEDAALDAEPDTISAAGVQLMETIVPVSPAQLSADSAPIGSLETSNSSFSPGCIRPSKPGAFEGNHLSASYGSVTCEEQSLRGYLNIVAKRPLLTLADSDMRHTSPDPSHRSQNLASRACSRLRGLSTPPVDTERLLRELSKLAAPLPPFNVLSCHNHRYLASVELLQDRPLMRALQFDSLHIELLEREWLDGADIVLSYDTAVVLAPLFQALLPPSNFRSLNDRLSSLSWRYSHLAVIFRLYDVGVSDLQCRQDVDEQANLFTRVINCIKKLHRDLTTKRPQTIVQMYFVCSTEQAATTARLLGDMAESQSQLGPWGDRLWMEVDEKEDERSLAGVDGMNSFAAAAILSQISLHDFLALRADQRLQLALPIPKGMIERFNEVIAQRREDVDAFINGNH